MLNYLGYPSSSGHENVGRGRAADPRGDRLAPDNSCDHQFARLGALHHGRLPEAIALLEQAAQGEPADVEINEHLGDAYYAAGRHTRRASPGGRLGLCRRQGPGRLRAKMDTGLRPDSPLR